MRPSLKMLAGTLAVAAFAAAPFVASPFSITLLNYIGIYALVVLGLVLLTGVGHMLSFGQAAFVGIAAYATAWATALHGLSPWIGLLIGLALTGAVAALLGAVTLKLGGHFLSLSTIAWGLALYYLFGNLPGLGGFNGLADVPPIALFGRPLTSSTEIFYLIWAILLLAMLLAGNLLGSREGRAMQALRGGAVMVESLGIDAYRVKVVTFVLAALLAALSGWLYAHLSRFVSPAPFDVRAGIDYVLMTMVGGHQYILGSVVGAGAITLLKNSIQDVLPRIARGASGQLEIVVFSVLFIVVLQYARGGVMAVVDRAVARLAPRRAGAGAVPDAEPLPRRPQPETGEVVLAAEDLNRRFGGLVAVNDVSFAVKAGEILGLIGPNGAGKSTLFNLVTGALAADGGRVLFRGEDITRWPQRRIARAGVARTFQHVKLRPRMTCLDNVLLGAYGRTQAGFVAGALRLDRREEARARAEAARQLARVGLSGKLHELAGNLPLGSQRVLEIARALAADPVLLVLDEPAAGLRRLEKQALADLLKNLKREKLTILLVEHDMEFVMGAVDRIVVMDFGQKLCEGAPAAIRADKRVQDAYLGGIAA
jgi:branched-chain amino acid transport system permease protein